MEIVIALVAGALLAVVFVVISGPLRAARSVPSGEEDDAAQRSEPQEEGYERAELEAARETKYREIRDAELDLRTGKLSREDYETIDTGLRGEALEILDRLEALDGERGSDAGADVADDEDPLPPGGLRQPGQQPDSQHTEPEVEG